LSDLPELSKYWAWVKVGQIADVQLGRQRSPKNISNKFPTKYIRAGNITEIGLSLDDVLDMEFDPQEKERFQLAYGDILLSEASGSASQVGKPAIWRDEIEECCFQNTVIRVRSITLNEYLFWVFKTYYVTGVFSKLSGGVGINHLSAGKLESMGIPIVGKFESEKVLECVLI
jgi:type I restriction enzyme, S subunit